jgi:hypothetical protein
MNGIDRSWALYTKTLPDGRVVDVAPLTFGRARIVVSRDAEAMTWDDGW